MTFEPAPGHPLKQPVMGATIKSSSGEMVGAVNTRMTASKFPAAIAGTYNFNCTLIAPPLVQGSYLEDFWLGDGSENIDVLEDIIEFSIVEMDIYGTGIFPFPNMGVVYFKPQWGLSTP